MQAGCTVCGSHDWIACAPGQAPYRPEQKDKVTLLHPAEGMPAQYWCAQHWPLAAPRTEVAHV